MKMLIKRYQKNLKINNIINYMGNIQTRFINQQKLKNDYHILKTKYNNLEKKYNTLINKQLNECVKNEFHDFPNTFEFVLKSKIDKIN